MLKHKDLIDFKKNPFELFNNWEVPFLLLGVIMVIALQAGVFLAREESDD